jgi:uncharacterized secreted protein with C-terminal beta-propeller domain
MTDNIFKEMREQMTPDPQTLERLAAAIEAEETKAGEESAAADATTAATTDAAATTGADATTDAAAATVTTAAPTTVTAAPTTPRSDNRTRRPRRFITVCLSAAASLLLVFVAAGIVTTNWFPTGSVTRIATADTSTPRTPADYQELYEAVEEATHFYEGRVPGGFSVMESSPAAGIAETDREVYSGLSAPSDTDGAVIMEEASPMLTEDATAPLPSTGEATLAPSGDAGSLEVADTASSYSETNVQVADIDEGDIVKTDGSYIYVLSRMNGELVIFEPAGPDTKELSRTPLTEQGIALFEDSHELYIDGTTVAVILYRFNGDTFSSAWPSSSMEQTVLMLYDVSNPSAPELTTQFSQSGHYRSSRLYDHTLYLISTCYFSGDVNRDEPSTYVPLLGKDGADAPMTPADIRIMPTIQEPGYTVVASFNIAAASRIDQKAVLGDATTVYMGYNNLYLGSSFSEFEEGEPYQESVYTVVDHTDKSMTQLVRIGIADGLLDVAAQCTIEGTLLNQFSLDEYEGNLRVAMTQDDWSYRILKDESHGVESYQDTGGPSTSAVYVLDATLAVIGSIEGLAEEERIYSVRFTGPIGYMVTFRQMDPLFALDLADPTNPKVLSELKIPGFSTYLHPFGAGRLLGLGYETDGEFRMGMKLSMFDVSDPFAVSELFAEGVDTYGSEALYDHKGVLVDVERNIIGFSGYAPTPLEKPCYYIYRYDDVEGFELREALELSSFEGISAYGARSLFIDDYLYVLSDVGLEVFDLETLESVAFMRIVDPEKYYGQDYVPMPMSVS